MAVGVPDAVRAEVREALSAIEQSDDRRGFYMGGERYRWDMPETLRREPALLRLLLQDILGLHNLGRAEKLAWEFTFTYRGAAGSIGHQKLGVVLFLSKSGMTKSESGRARTEINRLIRTGLQLLERRYLRDLAETQLRSGNVTIANQAHRLREMYDYFRDGSSEAFAGRGRMPDQTNGGGWRIFRNETEGYFNAVAMVGAYFGWLEHLLTLSLPFSSGPPPKRIDVASFMRSPWGEKFDTVFGTNRRAERAKERLRAEAARFRNRHLHGGLDRRSWSVAFQIPGNGPISMSFADVSESPMLAWVPLDERAFRRMCRLLDSTDRLLQEHKRTWYGWRWAQSGMDVAFDLASRQQYAQACRSNDAFESLLEQESLAWERAVDMDW